MGKKIKVVMISERKMINSIDRYLRQLYDDKKVSPTAFHHMQIALYGAKCIVWDSFGKPRKRMIAQSK